MSTKAIREVLEDLRDSLDDHPNTRTEHWARYVRARDEVDAIEAAQMPSRFANGPVLSPDVAMRMEEGAARDTAEAMAESSRAADARRYACAHSAERGSLVHIPRVFTFHDGNSDIAVTPSGVLRYQRSTGFWDDYHGSPLENALAGGLAEWAARAQALYDERRATKVAQSSPHRCPHDNVGCGVARICEVCKDARKGNG